MKYYKNKKSGEVYAYDDEQVEAGLVAKGLVEMTDEEIKLHLNPPVSHEQQIEEAKAQRLALRIAADSEIEWRQDAVDADIASDEEIAALAEWKKHRVLLMRLDLTKAPDIEWPPVPEY